MKVFLLISLALFISILQAQTIQKYRAVDSLIQTESMINSMTALRVLKANLVTDSTDAQFWLRYSQASYYFYRYEDAKLFINKAIKLSPDNSELYFEKGLLHNSLGELSQALVELETAVSIKPMGKYFYWKAIVNQQLLKNDLAEADYKKAIENKFEVPELYNNLAILLIEKEKYKEALEIINRSIKLNRKYAQAYSTRSKINLFNLYVDSACSDAGLAIRMGYKKAFEIPDSICNGAIDKKWQFAADFIALNKSYKQGIVAYSKLIDGNFLKSDFFLNRGYCYFHLKDYENAEKDYLQALTLPTASKDMIYDNLSLLYSDQNKFLKAIEYSTKRIELNPRNHVAYLDRGYSYRKLKNYKQAEKDFNKSLELKPDFFRAYGYRSYLFFELGQFTKSYDDALKSVELFPKYGYGYIVLAQVKKQLGMPDFCADLYRAREYGEPEMAESGIKEYCK